MSASTSTAMDKDPSENVRVVVRTRPLNEAEIYMGCVEIVSVNSVTRTINVKKISPKPELPKTFTFDYVFDTDTSQLSVYAETTKPIVDSVIEGYNGTVLAYGQTGAGKTYTMFGKQDSPITAGIVPNVFAQLYGHIARSSEDKKFLVCVSYLEIYNEEVRDLISNDRNLDIRECQGLGVYVQGLTAYLCRTAADIQKILKVGDKNRSTGATAINEESSRSHAILTVTVECSHTDGDSCQRITQGKLSLVDLAGSERQSKTQASGERLKEATKINLSLSVLGNVISALVDGKSSHIPYRNSKLTRLLQDSLGGSSKTVMIANIGPACVNYEETVSTLRYANRAKNIKNKVKMNEEPKDTLIRKFELQIFDLRRQLKEASNRKIIIEVEVEEEDRPEEIDHPEEQKIEENVQEAGSSIGIVKSEESVHKSISASSVKAAKMAELDRTISERDFLVKELERVSSSIIMGGENLLEKAQQQDELLEAASQELEERKRSEEQILENLKSAEAERIDIEERYNTLSEEVSGKTKKLNKLIALVNAAKADLADVQSEQQRELEGSLENMRVITRELQLCDAVINDCIPKEYMNLIESIANYNEETGEWQLKCVAYTGNNMQKAAEPETASSFMTWLNTTPEFPVYVQYGKKLELGEEDEVLVLYDSRSSTSHPTQSSDSDNSGINFTESELALFTSRILCETNIDCSGQRYIRPTFGLSSQKSNLEIPSTSQDITTTLSKKISFKTNSSIFGS